MATDRGNYRQCLLSKHDRYQVAWILLRLAKVGNVLTVRGDDGWKVVQTYSVFKGEFVEARSRDHRTQRLASDV